MYRGRERTWTDVNGWVSDEPLSLRIGAKYVVRVSAFNGAGLGAVYETTGVIVDPTTPKVGSRAIFLKNNSK